MKYAHVIKKNKRILLLLILMFIGSIFFPTFLSTSNFNNIFLDVSIFGMLAFGQTIVMIIKEIDLSLGSMIAFTPIAGVKVTQLILEQSDINLIMGGNYIVTGLFLMILSTIIISIFIGLIIGLIRVKANVPSLIITLGMLYSLRGLSYVISGGYPYYLTKLEGVNWLARFKILGFPVSFYIWLAIGLFLAFLLRKTKIGARLYAIGGNETAAKYSGINVKAWKIMAFVFSSLCAGLAAIMYTSRLQSIEAAQAGGYELIAVAIAVIGGTNLKGGKGSITGAIIASLIFVILLNIVSLLGLVSWYKDVILGAVIIGTIIMNKDLSFNKQ